MLSANVFCFLSHRFRDISGPIVARFDKVPQLVS